MAGLLWQQHIIFFEYFKYKVSIQTTVFTPKIVEHVAMVICIPGEAALDYNKINKETGRNWKFESEHMQDHGKLTNMTIPEINQFTYFGENILYGVYYWGDRFGAYYHVDKISLHFNESIKYYCNRYICYKYVLKGNDSINIRLVTGGSITNLCFNDNLQNTYAVNLYMAPADGVPYREARESRNIYTGNKISSRTNYIETSFYSITTELLPSPYETHCFDYNETGVLNQAECIERCLLETGLRRWNRIPETAIFPISSINNSFVSSSESVSVVTQMRLSCEYSCPNVSCSDTQIVTVREIGAHLELDDVNPNVTLIWKRKSPSIPSVKIICRVSSGITDLIIYMMSSISTWTGFSILGMNPIVIFKKFKPKFQSLDTEFSKRLKLNFSKRSSSERIERLEECVVSLSLLMAKFDEFRDRIVYKDHHDKASPKKKSQMH